mmetsp:Transcript_17502/g.35335  ORF Transcript_17502/g.35335 Transcript_17502/m.35335 type:complete len:86 (-) Transcript_17502:462-719(-)
MLLSLLLLLLLMFLDQLLRTENKLTRAPDGWIIGNDTESCNRDTSKKEKTHEKKNNDHVATERALIWCLLNTSSFMTTPLSSRDS